MTDNMSPEQRSRTMSRIRARDTRAEKRLRSELFRRGLRYRVNVRALLGCPDIVFSTRQVAVFVDGDYWHGWRFSRRSEKLAPYWKDKIAGNMRRDKRVRSTLRRDGWTVIRVWEHEIKSSLVRVADRIELLVQS